MRLKNKYYLIIIFLLWSVHANAAPSYFKGDADKVTFFNKITDYFATLGKDANQKRRILRERKYDRRVDRLQDARKNFNRR